MKDGRMLVYTQRNWQLSIREKGGGRLDPTHLPLSVGLLIWVKYRFLCLIWLVLIIKKTNVTTLVWSMACVCTLFVTSLIMASVPDVSHSVVASNLGEPSKRRKREERSGSSALSQDEKWAKFQWFMAFRHGAGHSLSSSHSFVPSGHCFRSPVDHLLQPSSSSRSAHPRSTSSLAQPSSPAWLARSRTYSRSARSASNAWSTWHDSTCLAWPRSISS